MNLMPIFVNIIAENMLVLFIYQINVVQDDHFLAMGENTAGLAEGFHFIPVEGKSLVFQIIDEENIMDEFVIGIRCIISMY